MRRPLIRWSALAAACVAVAVVWLLVPGQQPAAEAFNKFATAIAEAKTAKFETELKIEGQPEQKFQAYYLAPARFRQELPGNMVNIADWKAGQIMSLNPAKKMATVMNLKGGDKPQGSLDLFQQMRDLLASNVNAKQDQYQRLGEKEIDGRRAIGFRLDSPTATLTLWGDPATGEPVLIVNVFSGVPRTTATMKNFELNVELKDSLFDLTPPADYKIISLDVDASPAGEADFVNALRITSDIAGGAFLDSLDAIGIQNVMIKYTLKQAEDHKDAPAEYIKTLMQKSYTMGRGLSFALLLPETADAHYAGKGVKRDAKDTPIFWYKPAGKKTYQVIYADLSTHQVDQAPQVPGAVRIGKTDPPQPAAKE